MALETFSPPINPDYKSPKETRPRTLIAQFNDGYEQRAKDGINNLPRRYNLTWSSLTDAQRDSIITFFEARGNDEAFWWTPWDESSPIKFRIDGNWNEVPDEYNKNIITVSFKEVFDL
jgi:phage-related protein